MRPRFPKFRPKLFALHFWEVATGIGSAPHASPPEIPGSLRRGSNAGTLHDPLSPLLSPPHLSLSHLEPLVILPGSLTLSIGHSTHLSFLEGQCPISEVQWGQNRSYERARERRQAKSHHSFSHTHLTISSFWTCRAAGDLNQLIRDGHTQPLYSLIVTFFFFLAALGLPCCMRAFSSCGEQGLLCCGAWASHCGDFSCCGARALGTRASVVVARGL